jgi:hypothetical protein
MEIEGILRVPSYPEKQALLIPEVSILERLALMWTYTLVMVGHRAGGGLLKKK